MHSIIEKAHQELLIIRRGEDGEGAVPDAKGLVVADSQEYARDIGKLIEQLTKEKVEVIISDEPGSEQALERFKTNSGKWAVAVNKISEGVDVPPLYVGVYATRKKTPLIFRQIIGRFVRRRVDGQGNPRIEEARPAVIFMPAVPTLKDLARDIEEELRHMVDVEREEYEKEIAEQGELDLKASSGSENTRALPTDISSAELDVVIVAGNSYKREEYNQARSYAEQYNIPASYTINIANMIRQFMQGLPDPVITSPTPRGEKRAKASPHKYKQALFQRVEQSARKNALALSIEFKDFNKDLVKRFGKRRREMSIPELEEVLRWLENQDTNLQTGMLL